MARKKVKAAGLGIDKYICHCGDCPQKDLMI